MSQRNIGPQLTIIISQRQERSDATVLMILCLAYQAIKDVVDSVLVWTKSTMVDTDNIKCKLTANFFWVRQKSRERTR